MIIWPQKLIRQWVENSCYNRKFEAISIKLKLQALEFDTPKEKTLQNLTFPFRGEFTRSILPPFSWNNDLLGTFHELDCSWAFSIPIFSHHAYGFGSALPGHCGRKENSMLLIILYNPERNWICFWYIMSIFSIDMLCCIILEDHDTHAIIELKRSGYEWVWVGLIR